MEYMLYAVFFFETLTPLICNVLLTWTDKQETDCPFVFPNMRLPSPRRHTTHVPGASSKLD